MTNDLKIAVCFSGQLRTGIYNQNRLKIFFGELYPFCDFFIHTWNINTQKNPKGLTKIEREPVSINQAQEYISNLNFKNATIEDYDQVYDTHNLENIHNNMFVKAIQPLWYSFKKSIDLKRDYENVNNFIYDIVIKIRTDIVFRENRRLTQDINYFNENKNEKKVFVESVSPPLDKNFPFMDDVYFFSTSEIMDIISEYYDYEITKYKDTGTPSGVANFFIENELVPLDYTHYTKISQDTGYVILRPECIEHINSFIECQKCEKHYYG